MDSTTRIEKLELNPFSETAHFLNLFVVSLNTPIIDKSGANTAGIESVKADACVDIVISQNKYLNDLVEQDHRAFKRVTGPMLGFKSFWSARIPIRSPK